MKLFASIIALTLFVIMARPGFMFSGGIFGDTTIFDAAESCKEKRGLFGHITTINNISRGGLSPLMYAVANNHDEAAKMLIDAKADLNIETSGADDNNGNWQPSLAIREADSWILYGWSALTIAVKNNNTNLFKLLLDSGASVNRKLDIPGDVKKIVDNDHPYSYYYVSVPSLAIDDTISQVGWTPLMLAIYLGNSEIAKSLITAGADVNASDERGRTIIMYAAMGKNPDIVKFLIDAKAYLNGKDDMDETAMSLAAHNRNKKIPQLLEAAGAK